MTNLIVDKDARDKILTNLHTNFLVEAGAGSGKTTSLVGRMVNIIATGTGTVDEIVAITFTKKAADELKMRFQSELEKAMKKDPLNKERIAEGLQNIDQIYLGTVHSFCAKLLRERPIEANLDIDFQELDDDGDFLLLQEAWDEYLFKVQDEQPEALQQMEELGLSVEKLFESLRTLKEYPDVEWVVDEVEKPDLKPTYRALMNILYEARRAIPDKEPEKGYDDVQKLILKAIRREKVVASPTEKDLLTILESFDKNIKVTQNRWVTKEDAKFYAGKLQDFVESSIKPQLKQWREYVHPKIIRFLKGAYDHYAQLKKERSLLNFQDLLMKTADLLKSNPEVRAYFQNKYRFLLVDEFQDTDPIQAEIMFYLTGEQVREKDWTKCTPKPGSLFVVGDPKQAIYRFRRADIDTYNQVKHLIQATGGEVLELTMNFRTLNSVTTRLNTVFINQLPEKETAYQAAYRPLNAFHEDKGGTFSGIKCLKVRPDITKKDEIIHEDMKNITLQIQKLIKQGYKPKDFMIITRYNNEVPLYARSLEQAGIPVNISGEAIIGETLAFQELAIFLQAFRDTTDEVSFVAALRGIFFGISDDELYQWKQAGGRFSIFSDIPEGLQEETKKKFEIALRKMGTYYGWIGTSSPTIAIERMLEDVGFYPLLLQKGGNKRTLKSVLSILIHLKQFESEGNSTYNQVLNRFLELVYEKTEVLNIEGELDAVRVMNVHKSKGLEAPIVFLACPANIVDVKSKIHHHIKREQSVSKGYFAFSEKKGEFHRKDIAYPLQWESLKEEEYRYLESEELRIIYVAATRAEKALIISSCKNDERSNPWNILLQIDGIEPIDLEDDEVYTEHPSSTAIVSQDVVQHTNNLTDWIEAKAVKTYEHWSPTKDKDYSFIADILREEGGGLQWGSFVHELFEKLVKYPDLKVEPFVRSLLTKYELGDREEEAMTIVDKFRASPIWKELKGAEKVLTEVPFTKMVTKEDPYFHSMDVNNENIYVTGVIDLIYKRDDGWVIVDYKTDRPTKEEDFEQLSRFYENQIQFYQSIWESLTGEKVVHSEIYFVYRGDVH